MCTFKVFTFLTFDISLNGQATVRAEVQIIDRNFENITSFHQAQRTPLA